VNVLKKRYTFFFFFLCWSTAHIQESVIMISQRKFFFLYTYHQDLTLVIFHAVLGVVDLFLL
jgi:hypothetical protein